MIDTIYVEEQVKEHPRVAEVCNRFPRAQIIYCGNYNEVFNRKAQNFRLQKLKPSLILAKKKGNLILPAPPEYRVGEGRSFYFSHLLNCPYDCRYCFLQGMFRSAHYVLFVNYEDFTASISDFQAAGKGQSWFFSGYDCDSLALEPVTGFADYMLDQFSAFKNSWLELRTKSTQIRSLLARSPMDNVLIAFTLSPQQIARSVEHKTPSLEKRLAALLRLQQQGWPIGIRFDPLLYYPEWQQGYRQLFEDVFNRLEPSKIHSVSLGLFRLPADFARTISRLYPEDPLFAGPLEVNNGLSSYPPAIAEEMLGRCQELLLDYLSPQQLFLCQEQN